MNHIISRNVVVLFYISLILILVLPFVIGYYLKNTDVFEKKEEKIFLILLCIWIVCIAACFFDLFILIFLA